MPIEIGISTTIGGIAGNTPGGGTVPFTNTKSILLDGVDDFVDCGSVSAINSASTVSFSYWGKKTASNKYLLVGSQMSSTNGLWLIWWNDGNVYFAGRNGNIGFAAYALSFDTNFHHFVGVYNGSSLKIYIDGILRATSTTSIPSTLSSTAGNDFNIGYLQSQYASGNIDEVSVFNSELSASDVTAIYGSGVPTSLSSYSSLISWWRCGDGDTAPTLTDNGSGGNNGTMTNFSTFSTDVPAAPSFTNTKSIALDGVDDYVDCGNPTSLQITGAMTCSAWIKTTSTNTTEIIIGKDRIASGKRAYLFYRSGNNARFLIFQGGSASFVTGTSTINDGNWHHLLGVNDGTDLKIYVDGVLEATNSGGGGSIDNGNIEFYIGRRVGAGTSLQNWWTGSIDEVAVWNSDQSANASAIYNSGVPNDLTSLSPVSWWRCGDGDTSPTLTDNGSGGNNGTMQNFSTFSSDVPVAPSFTNTKSIALDGVDDFVDCGNITSLNNVNAFTTSAWFKQNSIDVFAFLFGSYVTAGNWLGVYTFTDGNLYVHFKSSGVDAYGYFDYSSVVSASAWFNLAIVFDGSGASNSDRLKVYVNGSNQSLSFTGTIPTSTVSGANDFEIARLNTYTQVWNGSQDEVSIFNTALTQTNINTIYGSGVPNDLASLSPVHWWRCGDGDTSPTLTDNGSGGNNGTMTNFSTFSTDVPT